MSVRVKVIELDGYAGWTPTKSYISSVDEFTLECVTSLLSEGDTNNPDDLCQGDPPYMKDGVISLNAEDSGYMVVLLD